MVLISRRFLAISLLIVMFCCWSINCLSCLPCDPASCPSVVCPGEKVRGPCGCCEECAKQRFEKCGGMFTIHGQCDKNLTCVIQPNHGDLLTGNEAGICKPTKTMTSTDKCHKAPYYGCNMINEDCVCGQQVSCSNPYQYTSPAECQINKPNSEDLRRKCDSVRCDVHHSQTCPDDSLLVEGFVPEGECCPSLGRCECRPERCAYNLCPPDTERVLVSGGTNVPGSCCDIYQCLQKDEDCRGVRCALYPLDSITCPSDSISIRNPNPADHCCPAEPICFCRESACDQPRCPPGTTARVKYRSNGEPGSCCDVYQCTNEKLEVGCSVNGTLHEHGMVYKREPCRSCQCKMGVSYCSPIECPDLSICTRITLLPGECCPMCLDSAGNTDGKLHPYALCMDNSKTYAVGETWSSDPCTHCTCQEGGVVRCRAAFCEERTSVTVTPTCPSLIDCRLTDPDCPFGFEYDAWECRLCQCRSTVEGCLSMYSCTLDCPRGYKVDKDTGCSMCECRRKKCKDLSLCRKQCPYGYKQKKKGCDRCRCRRCPPMESCDKECSFGLERNKFGCNICKCRATLDTNTTHVKSVSRFCTDVITGSRHDDGETWSSDCYICVCRGDEVMCDMLKCPILNCNKPEVIEGSCCPTCPGDRDLGYPIIPQSFSCQDTNGYWYVEGDTWNFDQCASCTCHSGHVMCTSKQCPAAPCTYPTRVDDMCCPQCLDSVAPTSGRSCRDERGSFHEDGSSFKTNPCVSCLCQNGTIICFNQKCELPPCDNPVLKRGSCCLECLGDSITLQPCNVDGKIRKHLEVWNQTSNECSSCSCMDGGVHCQPLHCPLLPQSCKRIHQRHGACCEECLSPTTTPPSVVVCVFSSEDSISWIPIIVGVVSSLALVGIVILIFVLASRHCALRGRRGKYTPGSADANHGNMDSDRLRPSSTGTARTTVASSSSEDERIFKQ